MRKSYQYSHYSSGVLFVLDELRANKNLCDGILQSSDEQIFHIHRCVLAAASPYFRSMFTGGFREASANTPIILPNTSSTGLRYILDYMYSGKLTLNEQVVCDVLTLADMMHLTAVLESCTEFLIETMSPESCFGNVSLGEKYGLKTLYEASEKYILKNFEKIASVQDFIELSPNDLCRYLGHKQLNAKEIDVFRAAQTWLDYDQERQSYIHDVMNLVIFEAIPANALVDEVMHYEAIKANAECYEMVVAGVKYHSNVFTQPLNVRTISRGEETVAVIASYTSEDNSVGVAMDTYRKSDIFTLNEEKVLKSKTSTIKCKLELGSLSLVNVNNFLYLFGTGSDSFTSVAKRFDASSGAWLELAPIPRPGTIGSSAACTGDTVVIVGGMLVTRDTNYETIEPDKFISHTACYAIACNDWNMVRKCPMAVMYHSSCACEKLVYIAGGYILNEQPGQTTPAVSSKVYSYDPKLDVWARNADINEARCEAAFEAVGDNLYLIGGGVLHGSRYSVPSIEMYSIPDNQWTTVIEREPTKLLHAAASFVDDHIIVIVGGYNMGSKDNSACVSVFDTETNCVTTLKPKLEYSPCRHVCAGLQMRT